MSLEKTADTCMQLSREAKTHQTDDGEHASIIVPPEWTEAEEKAVVRK